MTMAMKNPPRRTTIRGQKHLLAYITPAEAQLLMDNGGSGEPGPMGIPSFPPSERDSMGRDTGSGREGGGGSSRGDNDRGGGQSDEDLDQSVQQDLAAAAAAAQGVDLGGYQYDAGFDSTARGSARDVYDTMMAIRTATGMSSPAARDQIMGYALGQLPGRRQQARNLMSGYPVSLFGKTFNIPSVFGIAGGLLSNFNLSNIENALQDPNAYPAFDTTGKLQGAYSPGLFGIGEVYTGNRPNDPMFDDGSGRDDTVPASYNPNTGEAQCPDGYMFDEDLQACRLSGGLPGGDGVSGSGELGAATGDLYGRMGLLDIAPTGLGMFKQRFGAGFGSPSEFDTANMAFRRSGGVQRPYQGYTLLS